MALLGMAHSLLDPGLQDDSMHIKTCTTSHHGCDGA